MRWFVAAILILAANAWAVNLYDEIYYRPLIADRKAALPGDVLTVLIMETADAQTSTDLSSSKDLSAAVAIGYDHNNYQGAFSLNGKGRAAAKTGRNGKIKAALTVRIRQILPNHTYLVQGSQRITINGEQQRILLKGIVRPEDISPQNTILSTRLAQAQIIYAGVGSVSDSQNHNYMYKLLSYVGLI